jgi:hypothetical protein
VSFLYSPGLHWTIAPRGAPPANLHPHARSQVCGRIASQVAHQRRHAWVTVFGSVRRVPAKILFAPRWRASLTRALPIPRLAPVTQTVLSAICIKFPFQWLGLIETDVALNELESVSSCDPGSKAQAKSLKNITRLVSLSCTFADRWPWVTRKKASHRGGGAVTAPVVFATVG